MRDPVFGKDHARTRAYSEMARHLVEREPKGQRMNPTDLPQIGLSSSDVSLFALFWQAHWLVKTVMLGLIVCSVWVWAIAIDKTLLFARMRKAMDRFEQAFWSGQSLEELYRSLSSR